MKPLHPVPLLTMNEESFHWFYSLSGVSSLSGTAEISVHIVTFTAFLMVVFFFLVAFVMWLFDIYREWNPVRFI